MDFFTLLNGNKIPSVGFGTVGIFDEECINSVCKAIETGYRLLDCAQMYKNEKSVGQGIKKSGIKRKELFITSKVCRPNDSYEKTKISIEKSLENMQLDYFDLYLIHEPYEKSLEMYEAITEAYEKGLVKAIGISNFNKRRYDEFIRECKIIPMVNQIESHVFYQQLDFVKYLHSKGTVVQAWGPLAQGKNDIFKNQTLLGISHFYGKTVSQVALRYLVQNEICVIPKSSKEERMKQNLDIFDFDLTASEIDLIKKLDLNKSLSDWTSEWN